jgi:spermidine dehydrogenase
MKPKITRKDFLNGAVFTAASALLRPLQGLAAAVSGPDPTAREYYLAKGIRQHDPRYYPPGLTGMRGSHPVSFETAHAFVVGGGISGLSAAETR